MSEQNKDNISQFFRKAVQKPKIGFEESDWEKLEAKLDAASMAGAQRPNPWKTAFIAAAALLLVSTSLLIYKSYQVKTFIAKTKTEKSHTKSTVEPVTNNSKSGKQTAENDKQENQKTNRSTETGNLSSLFLNSSAKEASTSIRGSAFKQHEHLALSHNNAGSNEMLLQEDDDGSKMPLQNAGLNNVAKDFAVTQTSNSKDVDQSTVSDSSSSKNENDVIVKTEKNKTNPNDSLIETIKSKPSRWNVMLSLSPDFSSTDLGKFSSPGGAFGISAYYAINNKFSISAGVVKSNKFYWDNGNEYKPNQTGYWAKKTNGIVPTVIEGSCSVLEIPIGLQYYFLSAKKSKLYLASTISSYIMLKESYQYTFDAPNPGAIESWNAKKTSYSLFNVANIALGYERSISNRLMIGVSPYLKIPMSGIGSWANIKLYSTGAAFTLRYQFQKKKKPDRLIPAD